jgi:hypothetical protein
MEIFRVAPASAGEIKQKRWKLVPVFAASLALSIVLLRAQLHYIAAPHSSSFLFYPLFMVAVALTCCVTATSVLFFFCLPGMNRRLSKREYELTNEGLSSCLPGMPEMFVPANEIVSFESRRKGLYLHLQNRPRGLHIPAKLLGFEYFREKLLAMGIPEIPATSFLLARGILKGVAASIPMIVCLAVIITGQDLVEVTVAGICCIAFMTWQTIRNKKTYYSQQSGLAPKWRYLTLALWILVVTLHVWRVADHPHSHHRHISEITSPQR